jgi:hypothetical protein
MCLFLLTFSFLIFQSGMGWDGFEFILYFFHFLYFLYSTQNPGVCGVVTPTPLDPGMAQKQARKPNCPAEGVNLRPPNERVGKGVIGRVLRPKKGGGRWSSQQNGGLLSIFQSKYLHLLDERQKLSSFKFPFIGSLV